MAFVVKDRVKETCTAPGTGTVTLLGASTGYQSFSVVGNGNSTYYCIADQGGANWEVGIGTYTASGTTLSRDTVLSSSNGGAKTNFSTGTQDVFVTYPSERAVYTDSAGTAIVPFTASTLATTYGGTGLSSYSAGDLPYYATGTALSKLTIGSNKTVLTSTGSAPQWSVSLDTSQGGTGVTSYSAGDLPYYAAGTTLSKLTIGASTTILTSSGTAPQWTAASSVSIGTATNLAGGAAGSVPYQTGAGATSFVSVGTAYQALQVNAGATAPSWQASATSTLTAQGDLLYASGANTLARLAKDTNATRYLANTGTSNNPAWAQITLSNGVTGTLATTNGGTGLTSFTTNGVVYASSTSALATGSALTFDGTNFATTGTVSGTKLIPTGGAVTGNGIYLPAANAVSITTNGADRVYIDSSGNVGIGVTPSAWGATYKAVQIGNSGAIFGRTNANQLYIDCNSYTAANNTYINSDYATRYTQYSGQHIWWTAPSGTAGNTITFTQAMTLDASGDLRLGTTTALWANSGRTVLTVNGSSQALVGLAVGNITKGYMYHTGTDMYVWNEANGFLSFATNNTERGRFTAAGNFNIKGDFLLDSAGPQIKWTSDALRFYAEAASTERMRIDSSGRLIVGNTSSNSAFNSAIQVQGNSVGSTLLLNRFDANGGGPVLYLAKSRSGTIGTNTIVNDGDEIGSLIFNGANGTGYNSGAQITAFVDGTPGASNDMPGRLVFYTTSDGSATATERMRITSSGNVLINRITVAGAGNVGLIISGDTDTTDTNYTFYVLYNNNSQVFGLKNSGYVRADGVYNKTSATSANVNVDSAGNLTRATSALKYKTDIRDLPSIDINKFRPVVYKSKCEIDDPTLDHFGIVADEVDQVGIKELVTYGASGEVEGFQYERLTVVLLKKLQEQQTMIEALEARLAAVEAK